MIFIIDFIVLTTLTYMKYYRYHYKYMEYYYNIINTIIILLIYEKKYYKNIINLFYQIVSIWKLIDRILYICNKARNDIKETTNSRRNLLKD